MSTPSPAPVSLGLLVRQVRDALWGAMAHELRDAGHDLTFSQYITLKTLARGSASVTDLARVAELNPGAMTRLLDRLEARQIVRRQSDPRDRRALHILLTDTGQRMWCDVEICARRVVVLALQDMSPEESATLIRLLEQARDNLLSIHDV